MGSVSQNNGILFDFIGGIACVLIAIWVPFLTWHIAGPITNQWWAWPLYATLVLWAIIWFLIAFGAFLTAYDKSNGIA